MKRFLLIVVAVATSLSACNQSETTAMPNSPQTEQRIAILRAAYAAFNRGDIAAAVQSLDENIDWTEHTEFPGRGTYHRREGARQSHTTSRASVAEVISEPDQFIPAGDHIVVFVHARVRPKDSISWQEVLLADVYLFRDLNPIQMHAFADRQAALRWAGTESPTP